MESNNTTSAPTTSRDVRLLRLLFAAQGVTAYEDHVPLQLMDFAHRYTSSILQDATVYNDYAAPNSADGASEAANNNTNSHNNDGPADEDAPSTLTNDDIRLAIAARTSYQFRPVPPKKMLLELAAERNEKPLPAVMPMWGLRLPPEKYCLTASNDETPAKKKKKVQ